MILTRCDKCGNNHSGSSLLCRDCYISLKATEAHYPFPDDLKERLRQPLAMSMFLRSDDMTAEMESQRKEALNRITDLEARLTEAEAWEDALAEAARRLRKHSETQMRTADYHGEECKCWRCAEDALFAALAAYEARRKK